MSNYCIGRLNQIGLACWNITFYTDKDQELFYFILFKNYELVQQISKYVSVCYHLCIDLCHPFTHIQNTARQTVYLAFLAYTYRIPLIFNSFSFVFCISNSQSLLFKITTYILSMTDGYNADLIVFKLSDLMKHYILSYYTYH